MKIEPSDYLVLLKEMVGRIGLYSLLSLSVGQLHLSGIAAYNHPRRRNRTSMTDVTRTHMIQKAGYPKTRFNSGK
ncbi:MAG: hypothetical protein BWY89_00682 [Bacteroidetes bacterium ADurb.BinA012]|nr:MAG: hypothetical protein BWY89_00682 [Bacteroidetes bacterium ADurb.BinA012]